MLIPGSGDYFQAGLAIRAAVLSGAIRWAGKSNQLRVLQSNALCCLNLDPWQWWRSPQKGVDKPNCLFQHYFARDQVQSNAQWICSLPAEVGGERAEVLPSLYWRRTSVSGLEGGALTVAVSVCMCLCCVWRAAVMYDVCGLVGSVCDSGFGLTGCVCGSQSFKKHLRNTIRHLCYIFFSLCQPIFSLNIKCKQNWPKLHVFLHFPIINPTFPSKHINIVHK